MLHQDWVAGVFASTVGRKSIPPLIPPYKGGKLRSSSDPSPYQGEARRGLMISELKPMSTSVLGVRILAAETILAP